MITICNLYVNDFILVEGNIYVLFLGTKSSVVVESHWLGFTASFGNCWTLKKYFIVYNYITFLASFVRMNHGYCTNNITSLFGSLISSTECLTRWSFHFFCILCMHTVWHVLNLKSYESYFFYLLFTRFKYTGWNRHNENCIKIIQCEK